MAVPRRMTTGVQKLPRGRRVESAKGISGDSSERQRSGLVKRGKGSSLHRKAKRTRNRGDKKKDITKAQNQGNTTNRKRGKTQKNRMRTQKEETQGVGKGIRLA